MPGICLNHDVNIMDLMMEWAVWWHHDVFLQRVQNPWVLQLKIFVANAQPWSQYFDQIPMVRWQRRSNTAAFAMVPRHGLGCFFSMPYIIPKIKNHHWWSCDIMWYLGGVQTIPKRDFFWLWLAQIRTAVVKFVWICRWNVEKSIYFNPYLPVTMKRSFQPKPHL